MTRLTARTVCRWWLLGLLLPLLLLCSLAASGAQRAVAGTAPAQPSLLSISFGPPEIWQPSTNANAALHQCQGAKVSCVLAVMRQDGASGDAIAFYQLTGEFMSSIQGPGPVQLAMTLNPWAANENVQPALVGGVPAIVRPADPANGSLAETASRDPDYAALLAAHPNMLFWSPGPKSQPVASSPDGGQRFTFDFRLLDGCHACTVLGFARFAFDFGTDGTFEGTSYLGTLPNILG